MYKASSGYCGESRSGLGLNPYGTVSALKALVYSAFNDYPCGGVLKAVLPRDSSEYFRFTDANFVWVTDKYTRSPTSRPC